MNIEQSKIEQAVINQAAASIVEHFECETEIVKVVEEKIQKLVIQKVNEQLDAIIQKLIEDISMPTTNFFGEIKKAPITLREFIDGRINDYLRQQVDRDGKVTDSTWSTKEPRIHWLVTQAMGQQVKVSVENAAVAIKQEISTVISTQVKDSIDEMIGRLKSR